MNEISMSIAAIIVAVVNIATVNFGMPKKFSPLVAVVLGIAAGFIYVFPGDWKSAVLFGFAEGLGAVGFYSATKNSLEAFKPKKDETFSA